MNSAIQKISVVIGDFVYLLPEISLALMGILLIIAQLIRPKENAILKTSLGLVGLAITAYFINTSGIDREWFGGDLVQNQTIRLVKYFLLGTTAVVYLFPNASGLKAKGEYHFLLLMVLLGSFLVLQARNMLLFYLGVELISITSYVLIAFTFEKKGYEAGIKYLLFGAMASGIMLYGISLIYGLTGSLSIDGLVLVTASGWWLMAVVLFLLGLFFKLSLVPMHIWTPDAYQAGPTSVIGLISVLPKVAILVFFFEVASKLNAGTGFDWNKLVALVAMISMFAGNLAALRQSNVKRMMAYSSIAHAGFLVIGVISGTNLGWQAMIFYSVVYGLMNVGTFYFVSLAERCGIESIQSLAGAGRRKPWLAVVVVVIMIALVGLPPTAGFTAKILVFTSLWEVYTNQGEQYLLWLFILGIINAAISLFYYLKIPYFMIVKEGGDAELRTKWYEQLLLSVIALLILILFFKADLLLNILNEYTFAL